MESGPVVAILGGGIIGMSIAWRLAQSGASVTVFDSGRIGNEASWAGAGMLAPGGEYETRTRWSDMALESLALYPQFVKELEAEAGVFIDFRECGGFTVAFSDEEAAALQALSAKRTQFGIYSEQFPPARIPGLRPGAVAAQYYPGDSVVNPRDVMRALRLNCQRRGVQLREFERMNEVPGAPFDRVVIAAGAWSSQIQMPPGENIAPLPRAFPIRGHLVAFEEHTGLCDSIVRHGSTYLLRRSGDLVIAGASTEDRGFERELDSEIVRELAARAGNLVPQLESARYQAWNGFRPGSASGEPVLGRFADSAVWLAYGHYRNGILLAPATARDISREILSPELTPASWQTDSFSPDARPR